MSLRLRSAAARFCAYVALAATPTLSAQDVTGVVHVTGASSAAGGVTVVLLDSTGAVIRGALARGDGHFTLHAPHPGSYRVRARQIGFSADSSATLELTRGHATSVDLSLTPFAAALDRVELAEKSRCSISPDASGTVLQLWSDVQSALTAAIITESGQHPNSALLDRYSREIDPASGRVIKATSWQSVGSSSEPYSALPADSLAARGFVVHSGQDIVYYAPDARTLTSDAFARTHCFRPITDAHHPELAGLAFTPVQSAARGQVSGVLWLDRSSKELRNLDFRYSSTDARDPADADGSTDATGRIEYEKLPWGAWIVNRWVLHVPVVDIETSSRIASGGSLRIGATVAPMRIAHLVSLWEIGGDARIARDSASLLAILGETSAIQGYVLDGAENGASHRGASQRPVRGLSVQLLPAAAVASGDSSRAASQSGSGSTAHALTTGADGGFVFDSLPPGGYVLRIVSPRLDTLAIVIPDRPVHLDRASRLTITTVLPSSNSTIRALCADDLRNGEGVVRGMVRDSLTGRPIAGATVKAHWLDRMAVNGTSFNDQTAATVADADGRYALCVVPSIHPVYLTASIDKRSSRTARLEPSQARIRMLDFTM